MVTEQRETAGAPMLIVETGERATYAIPRAELDRFRPSPERLKTVEVGMRGRAGGAGAPSGGEWYELTEEALAPYRITGEQASAYGLGAAAESEDVRGYAVGPHGEFIGEFPGWVAVPKHWEHVGVRISQVPAYIYINSRRDGSGGYYPPLH
jgi:hypothetical protein